MSYRASQEGVSSHIRVVSGENHRGGTNGRDVADNRELAVWVAVHGLQVD